MGLVTGATFSLGVHEVQWVPDDLPADVARDIMDDLSYNPKLLGKYYQRMQHAVWASLVHPDTRPFTLTRAILLERIRQAHLVLRELRAMVVDELPMYTLTKALDSLEAHYIDVLQQNRRGEDVILGFSGSTSAWGRKGTEQTAVLDRDTLEDRDEAKGVADFEVDELLAELD